MLIETLEREGCEVRDWKLDPDATIYGLGNVEQVT